MWQIKDEVSLDHFYERALQAYVEQRELELKNTDKLLQKMRARKVRQKKKTAASK